MSTDFGNMSPEDLEKMAQEMRRGAAGKPIVAPAKEPFGLKTETLDVNLSHPTSPQDRYAVTTWGSDEFDFRTPSGQLCRMTKLAVDELVGTDILDRITRLPGFAEDLIDKSNGTPPTSGAPVGNNDIASLLQVLEQLLPMVVVQPKVVPTATKDAEMPAGAVRVKQIEFTDRIAIMERSMQGVVKMDSFREES